MSASGRGFSTGRGLRRVAPLLLVVAGASIWWLQYPPRTADDYRERSVQSLESLRSYVETARIWARELGDGDVTAQAVAVALKEVSAGARSTSSSHDSLIPPEGTASIRRSFSSVAAEVTETLGRLQIAAERDEWPVVVEAPRLLEELGHRLDRVIGEVR